MVQLSFVCELRALHSGHWLPQSYAGVRIVTEYSNCLKGCQWQKANTQKSLDTTALILNIKKHTQD
jgi:hypothetical protein